MGYEAKIRKELNKHARQWYDAVCPSVEKYGRQADKEIAALQARIEALEGTLRHICNMNDHNFRVSDIHDVAKARLEEE